MRNSAHATCALLILGSCAMDRKASIANTGFDINCSRGPCAWTTVEGSVRFGGTWIPSDPGLDLSGEGRALVEQRVAFGYSTYDDYSLEATVYRDPTVELGFEIVWYGPVGTSGTTSRTVPADYWEQRPPVYAIEYLPVLGSGLYRFKTTSSLPYGAAGMTFRIVKNGTGRCWVDELRYVPKGGSSSSQGSAMVSALVVATLDPGAPRDAESTLSISLHGLGHLDHEPQTVKVGGVVFHTFLASDESDGEPVFVAVSADNPFRGNQVEIPFVAMAATPVRKIVGRYRGPGGFVAEGYAERDNRGAEIRLGPGSHQVVTVRLCAAGSACPP